VNRLEQRWKFTVRVEGGRWRYVLRSQWNVGPLLRSGKLVQLLPEFTQEANVWAVYPSRLETSAKVRVCVEWLQESLRTLTPTDVERTVNGIGTKTVRSSEHLGGAEKSV
jgi:hypothetical protein